jgi:uncharacterized Fe-S center protein
MAEHALGVVHPKQDKVFYLNYLVNMTKECDCMAIKQEKILPDIGILAATDVVAIDQAAIDLSAGDTGNTIARISYPHLDPEVQLVYGEEIGLGSRKYHLISL